MKNRFLCHSLLHTARIEIKLEVKSGQNSVMEQFLAVIDKNCSRPEDTSDLYLPLLHIIRLTRAAS